MGRRKKTPDEIDEAIAVVDLVKQKCGERIARSIEALAPSFMVSTGSVSLDHIIGGGIAPGVTQIFGSHGAGKTSMGLSIIAQGQQKGIVGYYVDQERRLRRSLLETIHGLDVSKLEGKVFRPEHGQQAADVIEIIVKQSPNSIVVLDSIPACISSAQLKESTEKDFYAPIPKLFSTFLPKIAGFLEENNVALILMNQIRMKMVSYGDPESAPGGEAIKFYSDNIIRFKRGTIIKGSGGGKPVGHYIRVKTMKTGYAAPFQETEIPLIYGRGIDGRWDAMHLAMQFNLVKTKGAWYEYADQKFQGEARFVNALYQDAELYQQFMKDLKEHLEV
jgi:recombination protein RecA